MSSNTKQDYGSKIDEKSVRKHCENLLKNLNLNAISLEIAPATLQGDNYMGLIAKVRVIAKNHRDEQIVHFWIVKSAQTNPNYRKYSKLEGAYEREVNMYFNVFPVFENFQRELNLIKQIFQPYPEYYYHCLDFLDETLILKNMKEIGFKLADRKKPLNYDHVFLVIKTYAKFHAISYALKDQKPEIFASLAEKTPCHYFNIFDEEFDQWSESQKSTVLECFNIEQDQMYVDKFVKFTENLATIIKEVTKTDDFSTFTHGDCWTNNMLFKYEENDELVPSKVCFLDFQISSLSSPILDISYFLLANTDGNFRKEYFESMLNEYYSHLSKFIRELGSDPGKLYPENIYREHLKDKMKYGLLFASIVIKIMLTDTEDAKDFSECNSVDEIMESYQYQLKNPEEFKKRIRELITDCCQYGYI